MERYVGKRHEHKMQHLLALLKVEVLLSPIRLIYWKREKMDEKDYMPHSQAVNRILLCFILHRDH